MYRYIHMRDDVLSRIGLGVMAFDTWCKLNDASLLADEVPFMRNDFIRAVILHSREDDDSLASIAVTELSDVLGDEIEPRELLRTHQKEFGV